jgi:hypothetical protein
VGRTFVEAFGNIKENSAPLPRELDRARWRILSKGSLARNSDASNITLTAEAPRTLRISKILFFEIFRVLRV